MTDAPADALIAHIFAGCDLSKPCFNKLSLGHVDKATAATEAMHQGWRWVDGAWQCPECAADGA